MSGTRAAETFKGSCMRGFQRSIKRQQPQRSWEPRMQLPLATSRTSSWRRARCSAAARRR